MSVNSLLRALSHSLIAFRMPPRLCSSNSASLRAIRRHSAIKQWATPSAPSSSWKRAILIASSAPQWQSSAPWAGASIRRHYAVGGLAHGAFALPADYVPPTQPPSAKKPEFRKSQLLRAYTSLLRSTPLLLIFQHNNLTSVEWMAVRRELRAALDKVPAQGAETAPVDIAANIRMNVTQSRIFGVALKIVEFFDRASVDVARGKKRVYDHDLSEAAFKSMKAVDSAEVPEDSIYGQLKPLLVGPLALLTFPAVSPAHLAAVLSCLAPSSPAFPAPTRRKSPGYYDPVFQNGLSKLLLVGGRIEDRIFDLDGVKWVGGIGGGLDSLRAQLVTMLQSAGMGLTSTLEGAGKALWLTMEGRRGMLEEAGKGSGVEASGDKGSGDEGS